MKRLAAALILTSCAMPALANIAWVTNATIQRTLIQDGVFGGCMIQLDQSIADAGLNCPAANWVSLDCDGTYGLKAGAQRVLDSAQMAFALDMKVSVRVDDSKKHDYYCTVVRIDVIKQVQ
jgi:hypothetical protein